MERPDKFIGKVARNTEVQAAAAASVAIATAVIAGNTVDLVTEHKEQIITTVIGPSALLITYALLKRTLESAYHEHRVIGWAGFLGAAAFVADNLYNTWS